MTAPSETAAAFHRIAEERRTVRAFKPDPVPQEVLDRCLDSALRAPSSSNMQPWEFVVIRDPEKRAAAMKVCLDQKGPATAPLIIAVVTHRDTWPRHSRFILETLEARGILRKRQTLYWGTLIPWLYRQGPFGLLGAAKKSVSRVMSWFKPSHNMLSHADLRVMTHKSTALAAATLMLAFRAEGYDTCPMEGFDPWRAKRLLGLGPRAEVCMFLAVGQRADQGALWWERILVPREWVVREL